MEQNLKLYKDTINNIFNSVKESVGTIVLLIILEHAQWKTKLKYQEASLIEYNEEGICIKELEKLHPEKAEIIIHEFISCIIFSLGRLIGLELASKITKDLKS